jgi:hypothetical protein
MTSGSTEASHPLGAISGKIALRWAELVLAAAKQFDPNSISDELPSDPYQAAEAFNQLLGFQMAVCEANERCGLTPTVADFRKKALAIWSSQGRRSIGLGELRCMIAAELYREDFRLELAGAKDTRMQAAMDAAEVFIRTSNEVGPNANREQFIKSFLQQLEEKEADGRDDYETVRKSIRRYKDKMKGEIFFHLNPETLQIETVKGEEMKHGMASTPGRPRGRR